MRTFKEIETLLQNEELEKFEETLEGYMDKLNAGGKKVTYKMIAAALLGAGSSKPAVKKDTVRFTANPDTEYQRFFITIGNKDKVNKLDIVDFIKSKVEGLATTDFADVYILDTYSFFEVDATKKDIILNSIENQPYNDRKVHIEFSEMRKPGAKSKDRKSVV